MAGDIWRPLELRVAVQALGPYRVYWGRSDRFNFSLQACRRAHARMLIDVSSRIQKLGPYAEILHRF